MGTYKVRRYREHVYVVYTKNRKSFKVSTGLRVSDNDWVTNSLPKTAANYEDKQRIIEDVFKEIVDAVSSVRSQNKQPTVENVKSEFHKVPEELEGIFDFEKSSRHSLMQKSEQQHPGPSSNTSPLGIHCVTIA